MEPAARRKSTADEPGGLPGGSSVWLGYAAARDLDDLPRRGDLVRPLEALTRLEAVHGAESDPPVATNTLARHVLDVRTVTHVAPK